MRAALKAMRAALKAMRAALKAILVEVVRRPNWILHCPFRRFSEIT
jgi:hypothetical protein